MFGALKSLVEVPEDVEYREEALGGISPTSNICIYGWSAGRWGGIRAVLAGFHASLQLVRALWGHIQRLKPAICCDRPRYGRGRGPRKTAEILSKIVFGDLLLR